jgi:ATP-dependent exoDNAse (exonuclease V) beta subunit
MSNVSKMLKDDGARRDAISLHDRSILVEAGAGSGKTAVMAGRIAAMLAEGVSPRSIAAVTFTELAASELLSRVREFVADLSAGKIATELRVALPDGLSQAHRDNLGAASAAIDEITCSTIHGFCQRLIKPYPAEADIDPGAGVIDRNQADLTFLEIVDGWLRESLTGGQGGVLAEMVLQSPGETVALIHKIAENLRRRRTLMAPPVSPLDDRLRVFRQAAADFAGFIDATAAAEPETVVIVERLTEMATALASGPDPATPTGLVRLLTSRRHPDLCTKAGAFASYRKKGKWLAAAKQAGLSKADGDRLNDDADAHYTACCDAWVSLLQAAAGQALTALIEEARPILQRYRDHKRASAQLDFDDLIFAARDLLRDHDDVRGALGQRFAHVLVDEFQDTDPLQTEIFWRLCGEPVDRDDDWTRFRIRPGALFLVGDPKQAIYRFRGADVGAYVQARNAFRAQDPGSLLSISTNFRSCASILTFVNERFEAVLSADGQPGFSALDPFHDDRGGLCVAAIDIAVADENGKASAEQQRDAEAEGRPDAQEEAVALFTMHAAKGLEWPIVIPVNTMTGVMAPDSAIIDRQTDTFYCPVLGVAPDGYEAPRQTEKDELDRERIRLWYVAATRARELLVLPRLDTTPSKSAWIGLVDLSLAELPGLDLSHLPADVATAGTGAANTQTRAIFATEAEAIAARQARLIWLAPSRDENAAGAVLQEEEARIWTGLADDQPPELEAAVLVQGGRERGLILHKLMEEVLTGETNEAEAALAERAAELIRALGRTPVANPVTGLSAEELADCVVRTLALPDIVVLRPDPFAEFPVYAAYAADGAETATAGIADALTLSPEGRPVVVVDWKSDVAPAPQTLDHYRAQVRAYLDMTGAERGLIVLMTTGAVISVTPRPHAMAA